MAGGRSYRDWVGWQKAMTLVADIYKRCAAFPSDERFGLTSQVRRAGVSIPASIAEGFGRNSKADSVRFLDMACGSTNEVETHLLAAELGFADRSAIAHAVGSAIEVRRIVKGPIRGLDRSTQTGFRSPNSELKDEPNPLSERIHEQA